MVLDMFRDTSALKERVSDFPWLSFESPDLADARNFRFWIRAGEIQALVAHIAGVPLPPGEAKDLSELYMAKGALATTAIEGNSLTEEQVLLHLAGRLELPPSQQYLAQEIENVRRALNRILDECREGTLPQLTFARVGKFNEQILEGLDLPDPDVVPGQIRHDSRVVGLYKGPPQDTCADLLDWLCGWLYGQDFAASRLDTVTLGLIRAVVAHLYLVWIHPFGDGNGRTARLLEFQLLLEAGVPSVSAQLLSNHYNLTRPVYYQRLDAARQGARGLAEFLLYAAEGFVDGLNEQAKSIRYQHLELAWESYVREMLGGDTSDKGQRQLALLLELVEPTLPVEIPHAGPELASAYSGVTSKTLTRDLNSLAGRGLLDRDEEGRYYPARGRILAFRPFTAAAFRASPAPTSPQRPS